tara:strand:- start:593 stop:700 length:108 start_codon:yes stop_codon:yes gene_type:complete
MDAGDAAKASTAEAMQNNAINNPTLLDDMLSLKLI